MAVPWKMRQKATINDTDRQKNERWMNSGEWTRGFMCPGNILLKLHTHERRASWPPGMKFANFKLEKTFRACRSWLWWTFVIKYVTIHYPEGSIPEPVNTNLYDLTICIQRSGRSSLHLTFLSTVASLNTGRGWGSWGGRMKKKDAVCGWGWQLQLITL